MIFINRFWNWEGNQDTGDGSRILYLDGVIAEESWYDDDVTPKAFRAELFSGDGDVTIWINSPGGDCIAASRIYAMLLDYPGNVTVKIDGIAASAAGVIAMAGTPVLMAPTAFIFMHNPLTFAFGEEEDMLQARDMLAEVKEAIMNSYEIKTGLSRDNLSDLMDAKTWLSANKAIALGFADGMLQNENRQVSSGTYAFSYRAVTNSLLDKLRPKLPDRPVKMEKPKTPIADLDKRLALLM